MKKFILGSILFILSMNQVNAQDLCELPCIAFIEFPTGGEITASEGMLITFGTNGVLTLGEAGTINTAIQPDNLDYSAGGSLLLAPGESITFGNNGRLNLGDEGNINAINYSIVTSGGLTIFSLESPVTISGTIDAFYVFIDSISLHIDDQYLIITDNLTTTGVDVSSLSLTDFSQLQDGLVWPIDDNTSCTISGSQCITDTGTIYVFNAKGEIVEVTEGGGAFGLWGLLFLLGFTLRANTKTR